MPEALPFVDRHEIAVDADVESAWEAVRAVAGARPSGAALRLARALRCRYPEPSGPRPLEVGSTTCGFQVARAEAPHELALEGGHRFSEYALIFRVRPTDGGGAHVSAETRAAFPGATGRAYRAAVIGTRAHVVAVRRMLSAIRRRAERAG
jgi:hypothetical protein